VSMAYFKWVDSTDTSRALQIEKKPSPLSKLSDLYYRKTA